MLCLGPFVAVLRRIFAVASGRKGTDLSVGACCALDAPEPDVALVVGIVRREFGISGTL